MDGEVVTAFLISDMDVLQVLKQLFIFLAHGFLDHGSIGQALSPVALDFVGSEMLGQLVDLFFIEILG